MQSVDMAAVSEEELWTRCWAGRTWNGILCMLVLLCLVGRAHEVSEPPGLALKRLHRVVNCLGHSLGLETSSQSLAVWVTQPRVDIDLGDPVLDALAEEVVRDLVSAVQAEVWHAALEALLEVLEAFVSTRHQDNSHLLVELGSSLDELVGSVQVSNGGSKDVGASSVVSPLDRPLTPS